MEPAGASKHLRVLREVGLVRVRGAGKQRLYGLDARGLRPVHEWVGGFERFWNESFDRLDTYVQDLKQTRQEEDGPMAGGKGKTSAAAEPATADRGDRDPPGSSTPRGSWCSRRSPEVRHLSRWWGPEGFTTTTRSFEFREGGEWDFVLHGPGRDRLLRVDHLDRDRPTGADRAAAR